MSGKVSICKRSFTCRYQEQAKDAEKLEPKGTVAGRRSDFASLVDTIAPPAKRANLTHLVTHAEHGKPVVLRIAVDSRKARQQDSG